MDSSLWKNNWKELKGLKCALDLGCRDGSGDEVSDRIGFSRDRHDAMGRFHRCGGIDPFPTIFLQDSGWKRRHVSHTMRENMLRNQKIDLQPHR